MYCFCTYLTTRDWLASPCHACMLIRVDCITGASRANWEAMWAAVGRDHHHAGLIWNETTRAELRLALQVGQPCHVCISLQLAVVTDNAADHYAAAG